jgi:hypothetical protein
LVPAIVGYIISIKKDIPGMRGIPRFKIMNFRNMQSRSQ